MCLKDRPSPSYVLIQRNRNDAFIHCGGCLRRRSGNSGCSGGRWWWWWWRRWWWRRRRWCLGLEFRFRFRGRLNERDVRRGEKAATRSVRAAPEPPVLVFLHDLDDEFAIDERQLVVFCGLYAT